MFDTGEIIGPWFRQLFGVLLLLLFDETSCLVWLESVNKSLSRTLGGFERTWIGDDADVDEACWAAIFWLFLLKLFL